MTIQEAIDYLKDNGYKYEKSVKDVLYADHYLYKRTEGYDCQCNGRPPNIGYKISEYKEHASVTVGIRAENTDKRWCDLKFYSLDIAEVKNHEEFMYTFTTMWG